MIALLILGFCSNRIRGRLVSLFAFGLSKQHETGLPSPLKSANDSLHSFVGEAALNLKASEVVFFFGNCTAIAQLQTNPLPVVVTASRFGDTMTMNPLVEVAIGPDGASVSGQFFDKNGIIVAVLKNNTLIVNLLNSFKVERPDHSTLIVRDQANTEVLNIRFLNRSAFAFTGTLRAPDGQEAVITKAGITFSKDTASNATPQSARVSGIPALWIIREEPKPGSENPR